MEESEKYNGFPEEVNWKERALNAEDLLRQVTNTFSVFGLHHADTRRTLMEAIKFKLSQK